MLFYGIKGLQTEANEIGINSKHEANFLRISGLEALNYYDKIEIKI
jgi:hypothetical protein